MRLFVKAVLLLSLIGFAGCYASSEPLVDISGTSSEDTSYLEKKIDKLDRKIDKLEDRIEKLEKKVE